MCVVDCLELSKVIIDCFDESMKILISEDETDMRFLYVGQVGMSLRENDRGWLMLASRRLESNVTVSDIPMMYNSWCF